METNKIIFKGVVGKISEMINGMDKNEKPYSKGYFIVGEPDAKYPQSVKIDWYNHGKTQVENLKVGHEVEIEIELKTKVYQEKDYQEIKLIFINNLTSPMSVTEETTTDSAVNPFAVAKNTGKSISEQTGDLPF